MKKPIYQKLHSLVQLYVLLHRIYSYRSRMNNGHLYRNIFLQQGVLAVHLQCAKQSKGFNIVDKLDSVNPIFIYNIQNKI